MIIDAPAITATLTWLGISVAAVVVLALSFVAVVAGWQRYDSKQHVSALERYLAAVAGQHRPTRYTRTGRPN
jgi:membrane protein implicated in regulation of membrane protease activity